MLLRDDAIVLAGATGRVGGATLRELAAQGARLLVLSREREHAQRAIEENVPSEQRARCLTHAADLGDPAAAQAAVDAAVQHFGRIDAAVTLSGRGHFVPLTESSLDDLQQNLNGNLIANFNLLLPALRAMLKQPLPSGSLSRGRLVAVSAGSSKNPQPQFGLFGASKAALNVLMQAIAREHKADGIVANAVVLGTVATDAAKSYLSEEDFAAASQPEEVAAVLAFLASRTATGVNGALVDVNAREVD
ncbi:MAG TPA: SDR family oxidoreductase [Candidatus Baltobacteraceae bacterium]|nr:SDR family oxidoreductase [Candidatus Baltobacteraceae bacterium]